MRLGQIEVIEESTRMKDDNKEVNKQGIKKKNNSDCGGESISKGDRRLVRKCVSEE